MASRIARTSSLWADADELAASLSALTTTRSNSKTLQLDESQPPTPDETGRPDNFQVIAPGLYRSSYPQAAHYGNLEGLELKTIITLVPENLPFGYANFISSSGIIHHHISILANKKEDVYTDAETVNEVLQLMLDPTNYPMMIHCNKGKHRTGCMTACFRKATGWTIDACLEEYERYSMPKTRDLDKAFIERYDASVLKHIALERGYVGGVYRQPIKDSTKSSIYTANTVDTMTTVDSAEDYPNSDYQKKVFQQNEAALESARRWSHR